jgi:plastocyanin
MKKRIIVAVVALVALGATGYAIAAGASVTLSASGPQPDVVTVNWGDTVTYANGDSVEHAVSIPRVDVTSPAIPPGGTFEHVFDGRGGRYNFIQAGKRNFSGQVVVEVEGEVTLTGPTVVPFGKTATLSGRSAYPGKPVAIRVRNAGAGSDWAPAAELNAGADGSYSTRIRPRIGGRYQARIAADQISSKQIEIAVRPRITIAVPRRTGVAGTRIAATGRIAPAGAADRADLAAYDTRARRWATVMTRPVAASGKVAFRVELEEGRTRLRISVRRAAVEAGFTTAESRFVRVVGTKPKQK